MNFLNPNDALTAAKWNDLFTQADNTLTTALGGLSAVFTWVGNSGPGGTPNYADKQWDRGFFFGFDPANPPATLHPVALKFILGYLGQVQASQNAMFWRQYSHSAITGQLSGLSQTSNTSKWNVVKLVLPTWASWSAAVYPSGFTGTPYNTSGLKQTISSVDYPAYNCLDVSLQVHKAGVAGTPYNVTFDTVLDAEHAQPLKPVDVFILGNFTWDTTNWDKYSVVRVHNCGKAAATATFGSASATLPPGACKCFRKLATGWIVCLNYFHTMAAGDGRFVQMRDATAGTASIFQPGVVADVLSRVFMGDGDRPQIAATNFGVQFDPARFFDMSPVYNNSGYAKQTAFENTPPVGGYFPALADSDLLGDLIIHRGKVLVANRAVPSVVHATMNKTVAMTLAIPAPTYTFTDGSNTVANVSNAAVYNVTTGQSIPMQSNPSDPSTVNWQVSYSLMQIAIFPRGSQYDPGTGTMVPVVPAPYAPFISNGDVLRITFDYIPPDDHVWVDFDSFGTLAAKLTAVGLASRALSETNPFVTGGTLTNLEIYSSAAWHLLDLSCPLVTFLTGGSAPLPAAVIGSTQSSSPKSLKLPWLVFAATTLVDNPSSANYSYKNWATDSNGNPVVGSTVTVTVNNDGSTAATKSNAFLPTDAVSTLEAWLTSTSQAGGILNVGNFQLVSTPFGHALLWDEVWPLDARFTAVLAYATLQYGGNVRTVRIIYEAGVGLHVTRAAYLNETRYMTGDGYSNYDEPSPYEHGIFPPIGNRQSHPPTARRFMFWHYARVDRQFQNSRYYQHLSADSAWMPNTGWSNQKFASLPFGVYGDELSANEFNNVISFYEANPIGVDTIGTVTPFGKSGISRMGTFSRSADIWSPFAYWLAKVTTLTYVVGGGTSSINTSSGWYYANTGSVMSNATISDPIPSVLPCQMEHYNAIASLVNGLPVIHYKVGQYGGTTFTLNFGAGNIILVNGGSGYAVNDALAFNLKVASVDANGAITGVAQNGSVVVNSYDAYSTPVRPFALGSSATGSGATCDTSVGDGSLLNFLPTYSPIGVPMPSGLTGTLWPRGTFFSWNGATAGGADPVATYLGTLGVSVQSGLPDSFGAAQPVYAYDLHNDGSITSTRVSSYAYGFDLNVQAKCSAYKWMTIDSARTLYAAWSLPFVLDAKLVPNKFLLENVTGVVTDTTVVSAQQNHYGLFDSNSGGFDPNVNGRNPYYAAPTPWSGPTDTSSKWSDNGEPIKHIADTNSGGGFLGDVNQIACGFINDAGGNWVSAYAGSNISSAGSPVAVTAAIVANWTASEEHIADANYGISLGPYIAGNYYLYDGLNTWNWLATEDYTNKHAHYVITYAQPGDVVAPPPIAQLASDLNSVVMIREGCADLLVSALPQNVAYYDMVWAAANQNIWQGVLVNMPPFGMVYSGGLGTQVIPIIADNTVESAMSEGTICPGAGGVGAYETVITSGLTNARLVTVAIDGQINPNNNPPPPGGGI